MFLDALPRLEALPHPIAQELAAWLKQKGFEAVFLDVDPEHGIAGGQDWVQMMVLWLRRCQAVTHLYHEHIRSSEWCLYELVIASGLGKELFPLRIGTGPMPKLLDKLQGIDFGWAPGRRMAEIRRGQASASRWRAALAQRAAFQGSRQALAEGQVQQDNAPAQLTAACLSHGAACTGLREPAPVASASGG